MAISLKQYSRLKGNDYLVSQNNYQINAYPLHWHEFYEIEVCLEGTGIQKLNGTEYPLLPGTVTLLRLTDFHEYAFNTPCRLLDIGFSGKNFSNIHFQELLRIRNDVTVRFEGQEFDAINALGGSLYSEYNSNAEYRSDTMGLIMNYLFILILRKIGKTESYSPVSGNIRMKRAIEYIDTHFREDPTLKSVAVIAGYSTNYFSQCFSSAVSQTYSQYLCRKKINYSKILLSSTDITVLDIGMNSGFSSLSNFIRAFKNEVGISPSIYRKQSYNG